ncbi:hypothetical protein N7451_009111 [Penicillium sp. IBT 35674x]|uniref:uncharacterized protein n=1 Tax=Penicillium pulvis TaxID=1562058 RepID=UPI00254949A3|nr:uncharacterized protein N7503_006526 [Penicillium pulvis]KAJ5799021.1 hypothetical protein N7503_006526 [Penicillium pulvis]KAJ5993387.1 hypothetical protein N7451_009111 [Penicillium sp. IBT 35674x]
MPSTKFNPDAQQEFEDLVSWVKSAQMEPERGKKNRLVCVDKAREERVRPFLVKLGYANVPVKSLFPSSEYQVLNGR